MCNGGEAETQKLQRFIADTAVAVRCTRDRADRVLREIARYVAEYEPEEGWRSAA